MPLLLNAVCLSEGARSNGNRPGQLCDHFRPDDQAGRRRLTGVSASTTSPAPAASTYQIAVVGGGIAGLATALALARAGCAVRVFEARDAPQEAGAGIQLGPNATLALTALGVLDAVRPTAAAPDAIAVRRGSSGQTVARMPLGGWIAERHGSPYLTVLRQDLHAVLLKAVHTAPRISITYDARITRLGPDALSFASGHSIPRPDAVIVADGLWTALRSALRAQDAQAAFSGKLAARTLIATEDAPLVMRTNDVGTWLSPRGHLVHYPVDAGRRIAVVLVTRGSDPGAGWSRALGSDDATAALKQIAPTLDATCATSATWRSWPLYAREPAYATDDARALLIGDAAHPFVPFLAQGAAIALEDAVSLGRAIAHGGDTLDGALATFAAQRLPRARAVAAAARQNGQIFHLGGPAAFAR
ncbi:MAG: FAD-dependent oxidoreductase, partial [Pseudomonadota bacterium]